MNREIKDARAESRAVTYDSKRFSWTRRMEDIAKKGGQLVFNGNQVIKGMYRPFCKLWVYYDRMMNEMTYQQLMLSSSAEEKGGDERTYQQHLLHCLENYCISMVFGPRDFSCLMTNVIPDIQLSFNGQCFPLYWYEESEVGTALFDDNDVAYDGEQLSLFGNGASHTEKTVTRRDTITDQALGVFRKAYPRAFAGRYKKDGGEELSKEDIFFYVYGILHSPEYRERFAANLKKELPRIPLAEDFRTFSEAGRKLAGLHLNYESVEPWGGIVEDGDSVDPGRTEKMTFGKCKKDEEHPDGKDMTVLHVAQNLTLRNIPLEAYDYVVNGRSAIGWLMDRYQVRCDKASEIVNDPNDYSDDPRYIVDLVESVVTVSIETMSIVRSLPPLHERPQPADWPMEWKMG